MNVQEFANLRGQVSEAEITARRLKERLANAEAACPHNRDASAWSAPVQTQQAYKEEVIDWNATQYRGSD
ncbi:MAG: hypothetical protein EOO77_39410, partial [Oxalobacteraceae bacterium]